MINLGFYSEICHWFMSVANIVGNYVHFGNCSTVAYLSEVPNVPVEWDSVLVDIAALEFEPLNYDYVI